MRLRYPWWRLDGEMALWFVDLSVFVSVYLYVGLYVSLLLWEGKKGRKKEKKGWKGRKKEKKGWKGRKKSGAVGGWVICDYIIIADV